MDKKGLDELLKVKSEFTDSNIAELMKIYLETGSVDYMYGTINSDPKILPGTTFREREILENKLNAVSDDDLVNVQKNLSDFGTARRSGQFYYYGSKAEGGEIGGGECIRLYLNLPSEQRGKFANEFMVKCSLANVGQQFKYSNKLRRIDNVVIYSDEKNFAKTMEILKEMQGDYEFGEPCRLSGKYEDMNVGVASESVLAGYSSYNEDRLNNLPRTIAHLMEQDPKLQKEYIKSNGVVPKFFKNLIEQGKTIFKRKETKDERFTNLREEVPLTQDELRRNLNEDMTRFNEAVLGEDALTMDPEADEKVFKKERIAVKRFEEHSTKLRSFLLEKMEKGEITDKQIADAYRDCLEITGVSRDGVFTQSIDNQVQERAQEHERLNELEQTWKYLEN